MNSNTIYVVGLGGVGCYLVPALLLAVSTDTEIVFIDGDQVSSGNLLRQVLYRRDDVGIKKVVAAKRALGNPSNVSVYENFIDGDWRPNKNSVIFGCTDNNPAKKHILLAADRRKCSVIIGANEHESAQSCIYLPDWKGTKQDPRVRWPEILTDVTGNPLTDRHCTDEQEAFPQLAIFNNWAAANALLLYYTYFQKPLSADFDRKLLGILHECNWNTVRSEKGAV